MELTESRKEELNEKLRRLLERISERPEIAVTHFLPDLRKSGGTYATTVGHLKKIDDYTHSLLLTDGTVIPIAHILNIQSIE